MSIRIVARIASIGTIAALLVTGCRTWSFESSQGNVAGLAIAPDMKTLRTPSNDVTAAIQAVGGLPAWTQCRELTLTGTVSAFAQDGSHYLTEQTFQFFPWSDAVRITADEPRSRYTWQLVGDRYRSLKGDPKADISPLAGSYHDYAEAVLQIVTTPARLFDREIQLTHQPVLVTLMGRSYHAIKAQPDSETSGSSKTYWTDRIYYQEQSSSRIEMIWLGNPSKAAFLVVRGYDYTNASPSGVVVPTKIEIFRSDATAQIRECIAQVDMHL